MTITKLARCPGLGDDVQLIHYHDEEWGLPIINDQMLFENLSLSAFQAGLSWKTVLHKRDAFRQAFENFEIATIAGFQQDRLDKLASNASIIRNRLKIAAVVSNAKIVLNIQREYGSFVKFIWQFTDYSSIDNHLNGTEHMASSSKESDLMSATLYKLGFKFVGTKICYAFMQSVGMVNDHHTSCFRYREILDHKISIGI